MKNWLLLVIVSIIVVIGIMLYIRQQKTSPQTKGNLPKYRPQESDDNGEVVEGMEDPMQTSQTYDPQQPETPIRGAQLNPIKQNTNVLPYPQISNNYAPQQANISGQFGIDTGSQPKLDCFPKDVITPKDLMPKDDSYNTWQMSSPPVNGQLADRNFLESGHHFGIDTVSSSLRNPNLQLRSDPIIPQIEVSPWMQSTISPDTNRRQFEIGGDY